MESPVQINRIEIGTRNEVGDSLAKATGIRLQQWLGLSPRSLRTRKVFHVEGDFDTSELQRILGALVDPIAEVAQVGVLNDDCSSEVEQIAVSVAFLPGVTDTLGKSVKQAIEDCLRREIPGRVYSSRLFLFEGLSLEEVERAAAESLYNPLIQSAKITIGSRTLDLSIPAVDEFKAEAVKTLEIVGSDDEELIRVAQDGMLALNLAEMKAIATYFAKQGRQPRDAELECLAQTWSEHCKHKIFASPIEYTDESGKTILIEEGLFRRYIRGSTETIAEQRLEQELDDPSTPFLVSVFHDNAGVVRFTEKDHLVYKVETHNSPSALDPYGGAMTGIVGVNRDSFGTGLGADLLTNVWGYCFGNLDYQGKLPGGLMHPRRIRDGVHAGVIDGGNHSGIPYSRGFELFDDRYVGKPLVFCGTVARMPVEVAGRACHRKYIEVGDRIVMVGGRIGKDGIHGATFSSLRLDDRSPVQAVQIGDPIIQRMMWDMLTEARDLGLYSGLTDNGAGGLSSSVGELAQITNGARIDLALAPLKYAGLAPWEILISEAQERMTVAVPPEFEAQFLELAAAREVEATVIGEFTQNGRFEVNYGEQIVCDLELEFLHDGVPLLPLVAKWDKTLSHPKYEPVRGDCGKQQESSSIGEMVARLLSQPNLSSQEDRARCYDHEVKGLSVVKPWIGVGADVPSTATVMQVRHCRNEGLVLAEGVFPFYGDVDPFAMACASVDDGLRRVLCAGARIDRICALDNFCWPDPILSEQTPDGPHKLAQLVRCCQGLAEACVSYGVPLISGKDSMKNDAYFDGQKISIPPTLLVSVMGQMEDVSQALSLEPKAVGDCLLLLGRTHAELGGGEWARLFASAGISEGTNMSVPQADLEMNMKSYHAFVRARDKGLVGAAHVVSRGGLAIALAHMALASELGIAVNLDPMMLASGTQCYLTPVEAAFSESMGRILLTCKPEQLQELRAEFIGSDLSLIGQIAEATDSRGWLSFSWTGGSSPPVDTYLLRNQFRAGLYGR